FLRTSNNFLSVFQALSSADQTKVNNLLKLYGIDLLDNDGLSDADRTKLGDPAFGLLFKDATTPRPPSELFGYLIVVSDFNSQLQSQPDKAELILTLKNSYQIDLTSGLTPAIITELGKPSRGILFKQDGSLRNVPEFFAFLRTSNNFLSVFQALSSADQ